MLPNARNPKEAEAPLGCSPLRLGSFDLRLSRSASGASVMSRGSQPFPGDRRPRSLRRGFHPGPPCGDSFGRVRFRTLIGFDTDPPQVSLRRPHRVAPLREMNNAMTGAPTQAKTLLRFRELSLVFATELGPTFRGDTRRAPARIEGGMRAREPMTAQARRNSKSGSLKVDLAVPGSQAHRPP